MYFTIFNYLGAPKKYYGVTLLELAVVVVTMLASLVLDQTLIGFMLAVFLLKVIRAISNSNKFVLFKRTGYFHLFNSERFYL